MSKELKEVPFDENLNFCPKTMSHTAEKTKEARAFWFCLLLQRSERKLSILAFESTL